MLAWVTEHREPYFLITEELSAIMLPRSLVIAARVIGALRALSDHCSSLRRIVLCRVIPLQFAPGGERFLKELLKVRKL